jgi:RNA polymerase sigma factor (sigma-70 family)
MKNVRAADANDVASASSREPQCWTADDEALLSAISALAHAYARKLLPKADAEDVAQDVVLECVIRLRAGKWVIERSSLEALVKRMVRRQRVDEVRARHRRDEREHEHALSDSQRSPGWMTPDVQLEEDEIAEARARALERVPATARRVFVFVQEERLTYEGAAVRLGLSKGAVSAHVGRAKRHLRRHLTEYGLTVPSPKRGPAARG